MWVEALLAVPGGTPALGIRAGVAVTVLVCIGLRWWPVLLAGLLLGGALAAEPAPALASAGVTTLQAILAAVLLERAVISKRLDRVRETVSVVVRGAVVAPAAGAALAVMAGLVVGELGSPSEALHVWGNWWLRDLVGILVITPPAMLLASVKARGFGLSRPRLAEAGLGLGLVVLTVIALLVTSRLYVVFPAVLFAALRWHAAGAALSGVVVSTGAAWSAAHGWGPFSGLAAGEVLLQCRLFSGTATLSALMLGAIMSERLHDQQRLLDSEAERLVMECERDAEHRFRRSFEDAPIGMALLGFNAHFLRVNHTLAEILACERHELVGRTLDEVTHPDDLSIDAAELGALMAGTIRTYEVEKRLVRVDGSIAWVLLGCSLVRDDLDRPTYVIAQFVDISDRKRIKAELEHSAQELKRSNEELERFAYVASHDLGEPLRTLSGFASLLRTRYADVLDDRGLRYTDHLVDGAQRMKDLIDGLLEYSRAGRHEPSLEPVDCERLVHEIIGGLATSVRERDAHVHVGSLPTVVGDPLLLRQVLQNLIVNALKFSGERRPEVVIEAEWDDVMARFAVRDNGIGIDSHFSDRIFEMFQRLHTREAYEGTGIGLALAKRIVELHGGRIWFDSKLGAGTTFFFTMRLAATALQADPVPPDPVQAGPTAVESGEVDGAPALAIQQDANAMTASSQEEAVMALAAQLRASAVTRGRAAA